MSNTQFLDRAIATVKKAVELDNGGEYEKAYQQYYAALELFMLVIKYEKNAKQKQMIHVKAKEYMERAENLKKHLDKEEAKDKKGPAAMGSNGKASNGSGKGYVLIAYFRGKDAETTTAMTMILTPIQRSSVVLCPVRFFQTSQTSSGKT